VRTRLVEELLLGATAWRFVSASLLTALLESLSKELAARASTIARVEASPIELPDVSPAAKERRARHEGVELAVCVGRLVAQKRVDRVVDFVAARATATRLVVVGDGPLRGRLETYALRRGVDALFLGRTARDEALAWIAAADFVVHASEAEGRSTVEREAQALGVPFRFVGTACTF
jgi:glycosyltransferase involved in cell wall biosynthesis